MSEAAAIARDAGASFVHFLQPTAFSNESLNAYERETLKNPLINAPGIEVAFEAGYPRLRMAAAQLAESGVAFFDISDALDARQADQQVFLDFCHINHEGNRLVAQRMMDVFFLPLLGR